MVRRCRHPRFLDSGVLLIDKPAGPTSHDVVERLRYRFQPAKLGHAGTLDPFATGLLVLAFNQATRLVDFMGQGCKTYAATLALGKAFDTGDPTGQETATAPLPKLSEDQVAAAITALDGVRLQAPPAFSASKHQGRPLYVYARSGQEVSKPPRPITVYQALFTALRPGEIDFVVRCSRGTYLRSLAQELAESLGSVGHLMALRRLASEPFVLAEAVGLEKALAWDVPELGRRLLPMGEALARCGIVALTLDDELTWQLKQGRILPPAAFGSAPHFVPGQVLRVLDPAGGLVAILRWLGSDPARTGRLYESIRVFPKSSEKSSDDKIFALSLGG